MTYSVTYSVHQAIMVVSYIVKTSMKSLVAMELLMTADNREKFIQRL